MGKDKSKIHFQFTRQSHQTSSDNMLLSESEILSQLTTFDSQDLFLGCYSEGDIRSKLSHLGILSAIEKKGFSNLIVRINTKDIVAEKLELYYEKPDQEHLLIDLRLKEGRFKPQQNFVPEVRKNFWDMLVVEWLCLQNPAEKFTKERPQLPGQIYPGLGILREFVRLLIELVKETNNDGLLNIPEHYHVAVIYSRVYCFYDPEWEGRLRAMMRDLGKYNLAEVSHAVYSGCLFSKRDNKFEEWMPGEQIFALSGNAKKYFSSKSYKKNVERALNSYRYDIDWEKFRLSLGGDN